MKIKGRKHLEKKIQKIVKEFVNADVFLNDNFCYYAETNTITFAPILMGDLEQIHVDWIMKKYERDYSDPFIYWLFSLLHEVGHAMTIEELTDEDWAFENEMREMLANDWIEDDVEICHVYFTLPAEILATEWAIKTMDKNEVWTNKKLRKAYESFRHFYKKNA